MSLSLHAIQVENLRGYTRARLPLDRPSTVLVGKNNSGKTSILKLLDWLLNSLDIDAVERQQQPSQSTLDFLLPARNTRNRARRLWLHVNVVDARRHRRFRCADGIASLRVDVKLTGPKRLVLKVGQPSRGETVSSDPDALVLLREVRKKITFIHVPSFRDAGSQRFATTLRQALQSRLAERALHSKQAGAPIEYRTVKSARDDLKKVAEELAKPLWDDMSAQLPAGLARSALIGFECEPEDLVAWMAGRLRLRIATGDHDENAVAPIELGSGLQSLLDLSIQKGSGARQTLLAVEEPEAFLHPAAQRTLSRLIIPGSDDAKTIVTTHSPIVIEEASYGEIVLVRKHEFFVPVAHSDATREEINTALMAGHGAELMFSRGVLFVEGEGDRLFFEAMRRRIARVDSTGAVDDLVVVPVGGKTQFAPWIELVRSYGTEASRPIRYVVLADGDAASEVREGFNNARVAVPLAVGKALSDVKAAETSGDWAPRIHDLNKASKDAGFNLRLVPVDLESAALEKEGTRIRGAIAKKLGWTDIRGRGARDKLLTRLGSKGVNQPIKNGKKAPWIRGFIGRELPWAEVSDELRAIIAAWLETSMHPKQVSEILGSTKLK